jgi:hypothetical protein
MAANMFAKVVFPFLKQSQISIITYKSAIPSASQPLKQLDLNPRFSTFLKSSTSAFAKPTNPVIKEAAELNPQHLLRTSALALFSGGLSDLVHHGGQSIHTDAGDLVSTKLCSLHSVANRYLTIGMHLQNDWIRA